MTDPYLEIRYRSIRAQINALDSERSALIVEHNWIASQLGRQEWKREPMTAEGGTAQPLRQAGTSQSRK